ncbi:hypothetical protein ABFS82_11G056600 [Erythranthe guttata]|uniref:zinc finger CCCH domain-containing protein 20 n=1 Tax=Erythranthe guttata TaxID=4155 RepID=UPI00064DE206|nr:PREDICTED: zinc finger CCCH domain-containing protein 20 [Erythranthe guttata]|eukprot:XP_012845562.1 PREDICTED: zinc finger CCCH domain-containing protein 20 [Erythranthe guttata]
MMLGERSYGGTTVHVPPWPSAGDDPASYCLSPTAANAGGGGSVDDYSLFFQTDSLKALQRYLPSNSNDAAAAAEEFQLTDSDYGGNGDFLPVDAHTCDNFRMFEFKVRRCTRGRSHDWTECPFAHPGEKARRRDPRRFHYSGTACPDFRKGNCFKGDACEYAHGVFECWLHPARYRTQPCKDGMSCKRRVCFFAHSPDQLRVLSPRADGSPRRLSFISSPESTPPPPPLLESPPMSPMPVNDVVASLRQLHLNKVKSMPSSWLGGGGGGGSSSPRMKMTRPGYFSMPTTPTRPVTRPGLGYFEPEEEEPVAMVESGRDLRAQMFEKLIKENPLDRVDQDPNPNPNPNPDIGWVSELVNY